MINVFYFVFSGEISYMVVLSRNETWLFLTQRLMVVFLVKIMSVKIICLFLDRLCSNFVGNCSFNFYIFLLYFILYFSVSECNELFSLARWWMIITFWTISLKITLQKLKFSYKITLIDSDSIYSKTFLSFFLDFLVVYLLMYNLCKFSYYQKCKL